MTVGFAGLAMCEIGWLLYVVGSRHTQNIEVTIVVTGVFDVIMVI